MNVVYVLALAAGVLLLFLGVVHIYWAFGGQKGAIAALPAGDNGRPLFSPRMPETLAVAVLLAAAGSVVLGLGGVLPRFWPEWLYSLGGWLLAAVFLLRAIGDFRWVGLFKSQRRTTFALWDSRLYTPLCIALGAVILFVRLTA